MKIDDLAIRFLAGTPDGVMIADAAGDIVYWNAGCARIFGFTSVEACGQRLDIIIPENLRARHWRGWNETMRTGATRYGAGDLLSVPALRKDGSRISVEFSILPFRGAGGKITAVGALMRDVTERFDEMKALRKASAGRTQLRPSSGAPGDG
ncbi:MAG: PAS domain-containing protein [Hyphomicrobiaceae bacterium]